MYYLLLSICGLVVNLMGIFYFCVWNIEVVLIFSSDNFSPEESKYTLKNTWNNIDHRWAQILI